jgi:hypothetical protein
VPQLLDYQEQPPPEPTATPDAAAIMLAVPGGICWLLFALESAGVTGKMSAIFWPIFVLAALCAVISCATFIRFGRQLRWSVWLNLVVNVPGLIFTVVSIAVGI